MTIVIDAEQRRLLVQSALDARSLSYSPYSKFRVGAAILCKTNDGTTTIVQGANVENASYGATICAERTAFVKAVTQYGVRGGSFVAVAVASDLAQQPCSPCGICRQFIREFCTLDTPILMPTAQWIARDNDIEGVSITSTTLGALLPLSFGPEDLERNSTGGV